MYLMHGLKFLLTFFTDKHDVFVSCPTPCMLVLSQICSQCHLGCAVIACVSFSMVTTLQFEDQRSKLDRMCIKVETFLAQAPVVGEPENTNPKEGKNNFDFQDSTTSNVGAPPWFVGDVGPHRNSWRQRRRWYKCQ